MNDINKVIKDIVDDDIFDVTKLNSGIISESYSFNTKHKKYILRFNTKSLDFDKELYAFKKFSSERVNIPEIKIGKVENHFYALSDRIDGKILDSFNSEIADSMISQMLDILFDVSQTNVKSNCYGLWDGNGVANFNTWHEFILDINNTLIDKKLNETLINEIKESVGYCPNQVNLIHGDFGYNNLLSDGRKIIAVIDWGDSKYGDFVYDIAWLIFWSSEKDYLYLFQRYYSKKNISIPNFKKRVLCYINYIALCVLTFFEKRDDLNGYKFAQNKFEKSLLKL